MGQAKSKFSDIETNADLQKLCHGCREIELRIEAGRERERQGQAGFDFRPFVFHQSFRELSECARQCVACRLFRQALLLRQSSETLLELDRSGDGAGSQVRAVIKKSAQPNTQNPRTNFFPLEIVIGPPKFQRAARVACINSTMVEPLVLSSSPIHANLLNQARRWLRECKDGHVDCANLRWSTRNPTRLVRILTESEVQLVHTFPEAAAFTYAALSYCWGGSRIGITTKDNLHQRAWTFSCAELPPIAQDVIIFVKRLGIEYIWIDALCIVQDDTEDWRREAATMHEVYGNAFFTICASSNKTATERLFRRRDAWTYPAEQCRLAGQWLANFDVSLDEIRTHSTLADRAWTLQEERLSPRLLYWSTQRMYWSCSKAQLAESHTNRDVSVNTWRRPFYDETLTAKSVADPAQGFLKLCRTSAGSDLHRAWLDLIRSYLHRDLTFKGDRFSALSGLASRYYQAQQGDRYLAGLWKKSFPEDLTWSVVRPKQGAEDLKNLAPSWSWASLPLCTAVDLKHPFSKAPNFEYISSSPASDTEDGGIDWSSSNKAIEHGATVKSITVQGVLRPLIHSDSKMRAYKDLSKILDNKEYFLFSDKPEQPVHAADLVRGRVVAYEAQKQEVIGQFDYLADTQRFADGELVIQCLEVGKSAMLLLEYVGPSGAYRRVGVCHGFWQGFFSAGDVTVLSII